MYVLVVSDYAINIAAGALPETKIGACIMSYLLVPVIML